MNYGAKNIIRISVADNRRSVIWQNKKVQWGALVNKLMTTKVTSETMSEYLAMSKDKQDAIKDIGGFVGGTLKNGRRKNGHVESRSIVALDLDNCKPEYLANIEQLNYQVVVYSTHKHTSERPRLRLVIPLTREVTAEEYEPLARMLAFKTGLFLEAFDETTYEPTRLMFWPSTPTGTEFYKLHIDKEWVNPDAILAEYKDWRDHTEWPVSASSNVRHDMRAEKAGDPLTKPGIIGAFCQSYTIEDAIATFLSDIYIPSELGERRYTYAKGSTAGGLVIYDNLFAYSHHGTDPAGGILCNAFDLVRIHKFGNLDLDTAADTPIGKLPSYKEMSAWANNDVRVKQIYQKREENRRMSAFEDFNAELNVVPVKNDEEWLKSLQYGRGGKLVEKPETILTILENDPNLKGMVGINTFKGLTEIKRDLPWERIPGEYWTDADDAQLRNYLSKIYGVTSRQLVYDAVTIVAEHNAFNPVQEFIESDIWDGEPRVENLFIKYLGAEDTNYVRTITRKMLVAAVARIYEPGIKFDYMVTLVGDQGIGKSLLIYKLGNGWTSDSLPDLRSMGNKAYEALDGVWLMEISELSALKKADREAIKLFISKTEDTYRKAYARNTSVNKRTCIFIGTTNDDDFLNDSTGARRFLVIDTHESLIQKRVWDGLDNYEVRQIWAEAKEYYDAGENIMDMPEDVYQIAREKQEAYSSDNPFVGIIEEYLETKIPAPEIWDKKTIAERQQYFKATKEFRNSTLNEGAELVYRNRVCAAEIWVEAFGRELGNMSRTDSWNINDAMKSLNDWGRHSSNMRFGPYGTQRGFVRIVDF